MHNEYSFIRLRQIVVQYTNNYVNFNRGWKNNSDQQVDQIFKLVTLFLNSCLKTFPNT